MIFFSSAVIQQYMQMFKKWAAMVAAEEEKLVVPGGGRSNDSERDALILQYLVRIDDRIAQNAQTINRIQQQRHEIVVEEHQPMNDDQSREGRAWIERMKRLDSTYLESHSSFAFLILLHYSSYPCLTVCFTDMSVKEIRAMWLHPFINEEIKTKPLKVLFSEGRDFHHPSKITQLGRINELNLWIDAMAEEIGEEQAIVKAEGRYEALRNKNLYSLWCDINGYARKRARR